MAGTIYEFFGHPSSDRSAAAVADATNRHCPFLGETCEKTLKGGEPAGACTVKQVNSGPIICCPIRLYADDYRILRDVADRAFKPGLPLLPGESAHHSAKWSGEPTVAVFGRRWGKELRVPQKDGVGSYFVDWVLALLDGDGSLVEFVAVEVQTIDTTGNYHASRDGLLSEDRAIVQSTVGMNWENVNKRILPQLIYKGQVLQREALCRKGLFFVCPTPVYERIMRRVGGAAGLVRFSLQPASITFLAYDLDESSTLVAGDSVPLALETQHSTTVYKLQEAFNNVTLPDENVYKDAIETALGLDKGPTFTFVPA